MFEGTQSGIRMWMLALRLSDKARVSDKLMMIFGQIVEC